MTLTAKLEALALAQSIVEDVWVATRPGPLESQLEDAMKEIRGAVYEAEALAKHYKHRVLPKGATS